MKIINLLRELKESFKFKMNNEKNFLIDYNTKLNVQRKVCQYLESLFVIEKRKLKLSIGVVI